MPRIKHRIRAKVSGRQTPAQGARSRRALCLWPSPNPTGGLARSQSRRAPLGRLQAPSPVEFIPQPHGLRSLIPRSIIPSDRIDLYQLHVPDPVVPFEDSVETLAQLQ